MDELRSLSVLADGSPIAENRRIRLRGRTVMGLRPDAWEVDVYFLSEEDAATLHEAKDVSVLGEDDSLLASGRVEETFTHLEDGKLITTIMVTKGMDFWRSTVSISVAKGNTVQDTIQTLCRNGSCPVSVAAMQAKNATFFRGQTFHGRTADYVATLAKSIDARAYYVRGGLYIMSRNAATDSITLEEEDTAMGVARLDGAAVARLTKMRGYTIGAWIMLPGEATRYRLLCQSVDADNYKGSWRTELILVNEDRIETPDDWGGG